MLSLLGSNTPKWAPFFMLLTVLSTFARHDCLTRMIFRGSALHQYHQSTRHWHPTQGVGCPQVRAENNGLSLTDTNYQAVWLIPQKYP
jgi:hypothetical protein